MKKIKTILIITVLILVITFGGENINEIIHFDLNKILDSPQENKNPQISTAKLNLKENISSNIKVKFCPKEECLDFIIKYFDKANSEIKCAFFEFDEQNLSNKIQEKLKQNISVEFIVDDNYLEEKPLLQLINYSNFKLYSDKDRKTRFNNFMHNKFCIIDKKIIITGSTNPTKNGLYKNNNNILEINSKYLSENYNQEFEQMKSGVFGQNKISTLGYNNITLKFENQTYLVNNYFCPQDNCEQETIKLLSKAKDEIIFANFALTNDNIAKKLEEKSKTIKVEGIIEKRNLNLKGSEIKVLNESFKIILDKNKGNMHHKFFIIDRKIILTGSMNPTGSGVNYNDENIIVIENHNLSNKFYHEYLRLIE